MSLPFIRVLPIATIGYDEGSVLAEDADVDNELLPYISCETTKGIEDERLVSNLAHICSPVLALKTIS